MAISLMNVSIFMLTQEGNITRFRSSIFVKAILLLLPSHPTCKMTLT